MIVDGALRAIRGFMKDVEEVVVVVVTRVVVVVSDIIVDEVGTVLVCGKSVSCHHAEGDELGLQLPKTP
jgi:hypothetical protein